MSSNGAPPQLSDRNFRIAVDIGGTFTDCVVLASDGTKLTAKALTTTGDPARGAPAATARSSAAGTMS